MAGARQLLRAGKPRRSGANNRGALAGLLRRHNRFDPPLAPPAVDDRAFDRLDRDRVVVDVERAGRLTRRRADPPGEFGEIVGRMQCLQRGLPLVAIDEVVPVRDQVVDWAAFVTERNTAIHAARRLLAVLGVGQRLDELPPAAAADIRLVVTPLLAFDLEKAGRPTHSSTHRRSLPLAGNRGPVPMAEWVPAGACPRADRRPDPG